MSADIPANVVKSIAREFLDKTGRLLPEQFRERLDDCEVVHELTRRGFWCGDGPPRSGNGHRGFTLGDLWRFYCYCNSPKMIAANNEKARNGKRLVESARLIRKALHEFKWTQKVNGPSSRWFVDLASERGDEVRVFDDRPMIVGNLEAAIFAYADDLECSGKLLSRGGRKANWDERYFRMRWAEFAMKRTGEPLDSVGVRLFLILFGKNIEPDSYRRQRARDVAKTREAKRRRTSTTPEPVRTKNSRIRTDLSGQKPSKKITE
jgi:hypothetical protein